MASASSTDHNETGFSVSNAAAIVRWHCPDSKTVKYIGCKGPGASCRVGLDARLDTVSGTAFFGVRVPVDLHAFARTTHVHLFVAPEQLRGLRLADMASIPEPVETTFVRRNQSSSAAGVIGLDFGLRHPASLVGPRDDAGRQPKTKKAREIIEKLQSLARATSLTVHLPAGRVSEEQINLTATLLGVQALKSGAPAVERMYGGKGGAILDWRDLGPASSALSCSPPSYDEIGPSPPPPECRRNPSSPRPFPPNKKAKLLGDLREQATGESSRTDDQQPEWKVLKDEISALRAEVQQLKSQKQEDSVSADAGPDPRVETLSRRLDDMNERLQAAERQSSELMQHMQASFTQQLADAEQRFADALEAAEQRLGKALDDVRCDVDLAVDGADVRWEEQVLDAKDELRSFVREEMQNVEDGIKEDLRQGRATVYVDFG